MESSTSATLLQSQATMERTAENNENIFNLPFFSLELVDRMRKFKLSIYFIAFIMMTILAPANKAFAQGTQLSVSPASSQTHTRSLQINITISQVTDLAGWEFKLYYPNNLLNGSNIIEGPFLKTAGSTEFLVVNFTDSYNATYGIAWVACALYYQGLGASGDGILATITFQTVSEGDGILHLADTDLVDSKMPANHISHTTSDGTVHVGFAIDVAITNVIPLKTIVGWDHPLRTKVAVKNQGSYGLSFNVTLYARRILFTTVNVHLYASEQLGWGLTPGDMTSPSPTITVHRGDVVNLTLSAQALAPKYNFFVDYNGDKIQAQTNLNLLIFTAHIDKRSIISSLQTHAGSLHTTVNITKV
jgi:hypothetical protein